MRMTARVVPAYEAVSVMVKAPPVSRVVTVNGALVAPAGTVTLAAIVATLGSLLCSDTAAPPTGAAAVSVTVPLTEAPPGIVALSSAIPDNVAAAGAAVTVSVAD